MSSQEKEIYKIREIDIEKDLDQVIKINMISLPEHYPEFFWREIAQMWQKIFLVAEIEGKIVGYMMNRIEYDEGFFKGDIVRRGHVISIAVLPEYRRRGIGRSLMIEGMRRMKEYYNADEVILEVRVSNTPAIELYKKLGFKVVRIIPRYYRDGEDAYLMAKAL
ncbi:MAG: ribosomal protein S18-alanine N-acetyltransferase [Desulfurococcaceae archaeon]|jgi:ribosomal-protein-alanine N-acetyltransferase|nr:ribosomal protein S18-alanine N-acetyltransferase [Desulfurococcaceae archaeon]